MNTVGRKLRKRDKKMARRTKKTEEQREREERNARAMADYIYLRDNNLGMVFGNLKRLESPWANNEEGLEIGAYLESLTPRRARQ